MNKERILALADLIEAQPHTKIDATDGFNMGEYAHPCGTPCCIAGWATWEALGRPESVNFTKDADGATAIEAAAAVYLGLNQGAQTDALFLGNESRSESALVTPAEAAATLRHLAETGEVVWNIDGGDA